MAFRHARYDIFITPQGSVTNGCHHLQKSQLYSRRVSYVNLHVDPPPDAICWHYFRTRNAFECLDLILVAFNLSNSELPSWKLGQQQVES